MIRGRLGTLIGARSNRRSIDRQRLLLAAITLSVALGFIDTTAFTQSMRVAAVAVVLAGLVATLLLRTRAEPVSPPAPATSS